MPQCKTMDEKRDCAPEIARYKCPFTRLEHLAGQKDAMKNSVRRCTLLVGTLALALSGVLHAADKRLSRHGHLAATEQQGRPALWKVSDHDTTIYLFGTVHILPTESTKKWLTPLILSSLKSSNQLFTEVSSELKRGEASYLAGKGMLAPGQNLRVMMTEQDRVTYEKALGQLNIPVEAFDGCKPWYAALMLSLHPLMQQGYSPTYGVEAVLTAQKPPKTVASALETMEFQIGLFDALPYDVQLSYLRSTAKAAPDMKDTVNRMVADWLDGDADKLAELINDQDTDPALLEKLLYARNATWADWIKQRLDQPGTVFVAVGAGHLAGKGSVQDELRERGIGSERIQ